MKLKKNKFLIVGGTGFIGSSLARELVQKNQVFSLSTRLNKMKKKITAIVQARIGSERLRAKVIKKIKGIINKHLVLKSIL